MSTQANKLGCGHSVFAGFTEEELRQYRELEERIGNRILDHLQAETAKES